MTAVALLGLYTIERVEAQTQDLAENGQAMAPQAIARPEGSQETRPAPAIPVDPSVPPEMRARMAAQMDQTAKIVAQLEAQKAASAIKEPAALDDDRPGRPVERETGFPIWAAITALLTGISILGVCIVIAARRRKGRRQRRD